MGLPALALAGKLVSRAQRAGLGAVLDAAQQLDTQTETAQTETAQTDAERVAGAALLRAVRDAVDAGVDPESALRHAARRLREQLISAQSTGR